jgi:hypothetical protein
MGEKVAKPDEGASQHHGTRFASAFRAMNDLLTISSALERTLAEIDHQEEVRRHENSDVTDVMNWIAGFRRRSRVLAQNVKTVELSPAR